LIGIAILNFDASNHDTVAVSGELHMSEAALNAGIIVEIENVSIIVMA
jgi:hypothetical protein